jgi:hypothetical protein
MKRTGGRREGRPPYFQPVRLPPRRLSRQARLDDHRGLHRALAHYVVKECSRSRAGGSRGRAVGHDRARLRRSSIWELDRGGPIARAHPQLTRAPDFLFTQSTGEGRGLVAPGWQPFRRLRVPGADQLDGL